ncbi:MAG: hypothetical protein ABI689_13110 [Thermoanaerobaculia bacterium]
MDAMLVLNEAAAILFARTSILIQVERPIWVDDAGLLDIRPGSGTPPTGARHHTIFSRTITEGKSYAQGVSARFGAGLASAVSEPSLFDWFDRANVLAHEWCHTLNLSHSILRPNNLMSWNPYTRASFLEPDQILKARRAARMNWVLNEGLAP